MKILKKSLLMLTMLLACVSITCTNTFAGELRKGSVRVVVYDGEINKCEDELVYNGNRYLPVSYFAIISAMGIENVSKVAGYSWTGSNALTISYSPSGSLTLYAGSRDMKADNQTVKNCLMYPAAMYDGLMYVSAEDIATLMTVASGVPTSYGFDASKNTIYFY